MTLRSSREHGHRVQSDHTTCTPSAGSHAHLVELVLPPVVKELSQPPRLLRLLTHLPFADPFTLSGRLRIFVVVIRRILDRRLRPELQLVKICLLQRLSSLPKSSFRTWQQSDRVDRRGR